MAILQNQAKKTICQKVNLLCPSKGTPVQMVLWATCQNGLIEVTPNCGNTPTAAATKIMIIQGAATLEHLLTRSNPNLAITVVLAPATKTGTTHPTRVG